MSNQKKFWLDEPVLDTLGNLPVAQQAEEIYSDVEPGTVTLLQSATGSGKSLTSPIVLAAKFGGKVLVLVPSVDVARDNAQRIAELSSYDWKVGQEVGLFAGGMHRWGTEVIVATYGSFISNPRLHKKHWNAILLDESHTEVWQVEVSRSDVYARLMDGKETAVMELTATMNSGKLKEYWGHENLPVYFHNISDPEPKYRREMIQSSDSIENVVGERLLVGDSFTMVVQPGMREVNEVVDKITAKLAQQGDDKFVDVYAYHGQTDTGEVSEILSRVHDGEKRVVVCTPRLLTGFNHEDLDTVVTDGRAKYPYSSASGATELRVADMSQLELTQALGRVGRFKDGQLVLVSDKSFDYRDETQVPEVSRLSSLSLCLSLTGLGRHPEKVNFCNQPKDIADSMQLLRQWEFVTDEGSITDIGSRAEELEIRLDLAKFLLSVVDSGVEMETKVAAVLMVATIEGNGITAYYSKNGDRVFPPVLNTQSDWLNDLALYAKAIKNHKQEWVNRRGMSRVRAITYRLIDYVSDGAMREFFGDALRTDLKLFKTVVSKGKGGKKGKVQKTVPTEKQIAWSWVAGKVQGLSFEQKNVLLKEIARTLIGRTYKAFDNGRYGMGGERDDYSYSVARESSVEMKSGNVFIANKQVIHPRNGRGAFTVLGDVTKLTPNVVAELVTEQKGLSPHYDIEIGGVVSTTQSIFDGVLVKEEVVEDQNHPEAPAILDEQAWNGWTQPEIHIPDFVSLGSEAKIPEIKEVVYATSEVNRGQLIAYGVVYNSGSSFYTKWTRDMEEALRLNEEAVGKLAELKKAWEARTEFLPQIEELNDVRENLGLRLLEAGDGHFSHNGNFREYTEENLSLVQEENTATESLKKLNVRRVALEMSKLEIDSDGDVYFNGGYKNLNLETTSLIEKEVSEKEEIVAKENEEQRLKDEGCFTGFTEIWCRRGGSNNGDGWVVCPDGSFREHDSMDNPRSRYADEGYKTWNVVRADELAISWKKSTRASEHEFDVAYMPESLTSEQVSTMEKLLEEAESDWDGATGLASGESSPSVGDGWCDPTSGESLTKGFQTARQKRELAEYEAQQELREWVQAESLPEWLIDIFCGDESRLRTFIQNVDSLNPSKLDHHLCYVCGRDRSRTHIISVSGGNEDFFQGADPNAVKQWIWQRVVGDGSQNSQANNGEEKSDNAEPHYQTDDVVVDSPFASLASLKGKLG